MARRYETKSLDVSEDGNLRRLEVLVNHKRQGVIVFNKAQNTYSFEGDSFKKDYPSQDEAVVALCAKNGRKLELDKDKNKKKGK